jgi:FtsH-binding integral membrane protein
MIALYFILSALLAIVANFAPNKRFVTGIGVLFYGVQGLLVAYTATHFNEVSSLFFRFDAAGVLFFALLIVGELTQRISTLLCLADVIDNCHHGSLLRT